MQIRSINYINFRNLKNNKLEFNSKFNLFLGKNGQGKTSILEAIYFSITGKSFRTKHIKEIIKYGNLNSGAMIEYTDKINSKSIGVKFDQKTRQYFFNKNKIKFDEFIGRINVISFIPDDIYLILGNPSLRRSFFDYEISQANEIAEDIHYFFSLYSNALHPVQNKILPNTLVEIMNHKKNGLEFDEESIKEIPEVLKIKSIYWFSFIFRFEISEKGLEETIHSFEIEESKQLKRQLNIIKKIPYSI